MTLTLMEHEISPPSEGINISNYNSHSSGKKPEDNVSYSMVQEQPLCPHCFHHMKVSLEKFTKKCCMFNAIRNTETIHTSLSRARPQKKLSQTSQGFNFPNIHKGIPFSIIYMYCMETKPYDCFSYTRQRNQFCQKELHDLENRFCKRTSALAQKIPFLDQLFVWPYAGHIICPVGTGSDGRGVAPRHTHGPFHQTTLFSLSGLTPTYL